MGKAAELRALPSLVSTVASANYQMQLQTNVEIPNKNQELTRDTGTILTISSYSN